MSADDLLKRYRELNTGLKIMLQSGGKHDKTFYITKGYAWALYRALRDLGYDVEPPVC